MIQEIAVYGAGGFGREVAWLVHSCNQQKEQCRMACFVDDNPTMHGKILNEIPVLSLDGARKRFPAAKFVSAIGNPQVRETVMERVASLGLGTATLVHTNVECSQWVEIGQGTVICAGTTLTTNITLGRQIQINLHCTVGHDVIMGDYTTLAPGVHVSGWVHFGRRVYVGTGAVIINGTRANPLTIGDDAVIGAGACVTQSVPPKTTVVGVPARALQRS
jgi:sugar O-acyltransferase (sialic acid O-acetyltransferase NeuD family)